MRQRIRSHLTYANVMATLAVFLVLGGGTALASYVISSNSQVGPGTISGHQPPSGDHSNIISGSVNGTDLASGSVGTGKLASGAVTNEKLAGGAVTSTKVADNSLTGADLNESTLGTVPNADELDGIDSTAFVRGQGRVAFFDQGVPADGGSHSLFALPWVALSGKCGGTSGDGNALATNLNNSPMEAYVDNGEADPLHQRIDPGVSIGYPTHASGDWLTFSLEYAGKQATAYVFSYAFHNPVLNKDVCQYQGYVIVNGAGA